MPAKHLKENPVHFPPDRRFFVWIRRPVVAIPLGLLLALLALAWGQYLWAGLPRIPLGLSPGTVPLEFPAWLRITHYLNFLFLILLARSGLSILMDHPRLYANDHCTPGTEWLRFTPVEVPAGQDYTAKEDARYISPWLALPGYRHTIGMARHWHFLPALFWFINGVVFVALLFGTGQWRRLVPDSWSVLPEAWNIFVHYATFHIPPKLEVLHAYNPLQQLSYFDVVFVLAPLSFLTGLAMSPSIGSRFPWYPRLFGDRQCARSFHFILLLSYLAFLIGHIAMVSLTGLARNMNHIVLGVDGGGWLGAALGLAGIASVAGICTLAHWTAWTHPRAMQHIVRTIHNRVMRRLLFRHLAPRAEFSREDISPFFWPNGKVPASEKWRTLAADDFKNFKLTVQGRVTNPVELSLDEMKAMGKQEQITLHHCIQGWSGIAQWGGLPMAKLVELVRPAPEAKVCVFHSFGEGLYGGEYYDTQRLENALQSQCILAYEMNDQPLGRLYGAPLRLRVENQLGYKMVKWIRSIEFVASEKDVGKGHGGKNEDDEYFDLIPEI